MLAETMSPSDGARLIDGVAVAKAVREDVARDTALLRERGIVPGLTVVIIGEDPASVTYVRSKEKASVQAGMKGETIRLPSDRLAGGAGRAYRQVKR